MPHISENFHTYTDGNDLAILLNEETFVSGAAVFLIPEASTSRDTWGRAAFVVRGLLRRPSVVDSPTVTFCSVHLHNKVAKKRVASTSLLQRHELHHHAETAAHLEGPIPIGAVRLPLESGNGPDAKVLQKYHCRGNDCRFHGCGFNFAN